MIRYYADVESIVINESEPLDRKLCAKNTHKFFLEVLDSFYGGCTNELRAFENSHTF